MGRVFNKERRAWRGQCWRMLAQNLKQHAESWSTRELRAVAHKVIHTHRCHTPAHTLLNIVLQARTRLQKGFERETYNLLFHKVRSVVARRTGISIPAQIAIPYPTCNYPDLDMLQQRVKRALHTLGLPRAIVQYITQVTCYTANVHTTFPKCTYTSRAAPSRKWEAGRLWNPPPLLAGWLARPRKTAKIRSAPLYRLFSWLVWVWVWVWVCKGGGGQPPFRNTLTSPPKKNKFWPLYMIVASVSGPHPTLGPQRGWGSAVPHPRSYRQCVNLLGMPTKSHILSYLKNACTGASPCMLADVSWTRGRYNTMQRQLCW